MRRILSITLWVLVATFAGTAQTIHEFSLQEAMDHAILHNYQLQQSKLDVEIAKRKVKETTAIGLPQVSADASFNYYIDIPTQVAPAFDLGIPGIPAPDPNDLQEFQFGLPYTASAGITASQLIFDGSYFVGLKAAKEYVHQSELGLQKSEVEVRTGVAQTYYGLLVTSQSIDLLKENLETTENSAKEARAMYEAGFMEKQSADQVTLLESNTKNQLDYTERQYANMLNMLKFQLGIPITDSVRLTEDVDAIIEEQSGASLALLDQAFSPSRHIDFQTLEQGERLSGLSLSNEKARYYPQLSAFFNHSQNGFAQDFGDLFSNEFYPSTIAGLQLKVPLFSSFRSRQRIMQSKLDLEKLRSQKTQLEQSLNMQVLTTKNSYSSALERYETVKQDLELAQSIKETTQKKYNQGLASSNDLITVESQYLSTLGNYINTTLEMLNSKLELDKALGNY